MSYSTQRVVSDGSLVLLSVSIGYLERSHIHVFFDNVENDLPWSWVGLTDNQIAFSPAVPNGVEVLVARKTDLSEPYHIFTQGAQFTAESLDEDIQQVLFIAQEATEQALTGDFYQDVNMHGFRVTNAAAAVDPQDAMTLGQAIGVIQPYSDAAAASAILADSYADAASISAAAAAASAASINVGVPGGVATLNGASKVVQKALDADHADVATLATTATTADLATLATTATTATTATAATTAANLQGRAQLGTSLTATQNFTLTAEAANGSMKLARGNAGATTQDIMTVDAAGVVSFPQNPTEPEQRIGVGQTYQNMTASRVSGTTYQNTTGRPIFLSYWWEGTSGTTVNCNLYVDGDTVGALHIPPVAGYSPRGQLTAVVPPGSSFRHVQTTAAVRTLMELR